MRQRAPRSTLFPYTTLFRSRLPVTEDVVDAGQARRDPRGVEDGRADVAVSLLVVQASPDVEEEVFADLELVERVEPVDLPVRDRLCGIDEGVALVVRRQRDVTRHRIEIRDV